MDEETKKALAAIKDSLDLIAQIVVEEHLAQYHRPPWWRRLLGRPSSSDAATPAQ